MGQDNCQYSDSLRGGRSGDRIPDGVRFSALVQPGTEANPASCTMAPGSFPGIKQPGCAINHTSLSSYTSTLPLYLHGRLQVVSFSPVPMGLKVTWARVSQAIFTNKVLPQKLFVACLMRMSESTECKMIGTFLNSKTPGSGLGLIMVLFWHCSLEQRRTMTTTVRTVQCPR